MEVNNFKLVFLFRIGTFVAISLGMLPGFLSAFTQDKIILIIVIFLLVLALWIVFLPSYFSFEIAQRKLYVSTDKEGKDECFLIVEVENFIDYQIEKSVYGLRKKLFIYKQTPQGIMKSKTINVSLASPKIIQNLENMLRNIRKPNSLNLHKV